MKFRALNKILQDLRKLQQSDKRFKNHRLEFGYKYKNGIRTDELAIRVLVAKKRSKKELGAAMIPKRIMGFPTDVIETNGKKECTERDPTTYFDVLQGGIEMNNSVLNNNEGTLGCLVLRDDIPYGLTCHHVLFGRHHNGVGGTVTQPAKGMKDIGFALDNPLLYDIDLDCAVFVTNNRLYNTDHNINGICGLIKSNTHPLPGMKVFKYGRTTHFSRGIIAGVGSDQKFTIGKVDETDPKDLSDKGDSGALWLTEHNGFLQGVGLHSEGQHGKIATAIELVSVFRKLRLKHISHQIQNPVGS